MRVTSLEEESDVPWGMPSLGSPDQTDHGEPRRFGREKTAPFESLEHHVGVVTGALDAASAHERIWEWLEQIEGIRERSRVRIPSGGLGTSIEFVVEAGTIVSAPHQRQRAFYDLDYKRERPEAFGPDADPTTHFWQTDMGPSMRMLARQLSRGAMLQRERGALERAQWEDDYVFERGRIEPIELMRAVGVESAPEDRACALYERVHARATKAWLFKRSSSGPMLVDYSHGEGVASTRATLAYLEEMMDGMEEARMSVLRTSETSWAGSWTDEWMMLCTFHNQHMGQVFLAYQDLDSEGSTET